MSGSVAEQAVAPMVEAPAEAPPEAEAANDAGPVVKPILIGAETEPPAEKKRGWWRR